MAENLDACGWAMWQPQLGHSLRDALRATIFANEGAGQRCLLDQTSTAEAAICIKDSLIQQNMLPRTAVAIQAIAFDKSAATNWKVTWHQDLMFPFRQPVTAKDFILPVKKEGVDYARPPLDVLEKLLAVRVHLDDCDENNGPLRIAPKTHRRGIFKSTEISSSVEQAGEVACLAGEGEALLMRPLVLHASSPATQPRHRRVLHLVYHTGEVIPEAWHRSI